MDLERIRGYNHSATVVNYCVCQPVVRFPMLHLCDGLAWDCFAAYVSLPLKGDQSVGVASVIRSTADPMSGPVCAECHGASYCMYLATGRNGEPGAK